MYIHIEPLLCCATACHSNIFIMFARPYGSLLTVCHPCDQPQDYKWLSELLIVVQTSPLRAHHLQGLNGRLAIRPQYYGVSITTDCPYCGQAISGMLDMRMPNVQKYRRDYTINVNDHQCASGTLPSEHLRSLFTLPCHEDRIPGPKKRMLLETGSF